MSFKKHELFTLRKNLDSSEFFFIGIRVVHLFGFLCYAFPLFLSSLCFLCPLLPLSLDCPPLDNHFGFLYLNHILNILNAC